jgi:hypothetical protein
LAIRVLASTRSHIAITITITVTNLLMYLHIIVYLQ